MAIKGKRLQSVEFERVHSPSWSKYEACLIFFRLPPKNLVTDQCSDVCNSVDCNNGIGARYHFLWGKQKFFQLNESYQMIKWELFLFILFVRVHVYSISSHDIMSLKVTIVYVVTTTTSYPEIVLQKPVVHRNIIKWHPSPKCRLLHHIQVLHFEHHSPRSGFGQFPTHASFENEHHWVSEKSDKTI